MRANAKKTKLFAIRGMYRLICMVLLARFDSFQLKLRTLGHRPYGPNCCEAEGRRTLGGNLDTPQLKSRLSTGKRESEINTEAAEELEKKG